MKQISWPIPLGAKIIDFGLTRVFAALELLGNPQNNLPKTIHVAGTNGKGSTIAFIRAILQEMGCRVHQYTSPHLINFNERIVLNGEEISDKMLDDVLQFTKKCTEKELPLTYFEATTLAAMVAFSRVEADFLLLETGLGGRLDATNFLGKEYLNAQGHKKITPSPIASVITPIALDHTEYLGDTIAKIAYEKACIIKENTPVIVAKQEAEAEEVINKKANEMHAKTINFSQDYNIRKLDTGKYEYEGKKINLCLTNIALKGEHQFYNAATAIAAIENILPHTGKSIDDAKLASLVTIGLSKALHKARMQNLSHEFYFASYKNIKNITLDGGHNPHAATTIAEYYQNRSGGKSERKVAIISILSNKDYNSYLDIIEDFFDVMCLCGMNDESVFDYCKVAEERNKISKGGKYITADNFQGAIEKINKNNPLIDELFIGGSLYFAGEILEFI